MIKKGRYMSSISEIVKPPTQPGFFIYGNIPNKLTYQDVYSIYNECEGFISVDTINIIEDRVFFFVAFDTADHVTNGLEKQGPGKITLLNGETICVFIQVRYPSSN